MLTEGMYLQDRYEIVEKIGVGGMSVVYKAKDHTLSRNVAIKILKSEFSDDENFLGKFRTEAQAAAGLEHPNIVNVYDVGFEQGMNFIVMEYVEGITLKTYIEKKGQIGFKEAVSIAIQVAKGIEAAHNKSIIHRDIKPQNIIISTEGKVKVTDFGIARAATSDTISTDVMGSVHYASPEQARNGFIDGKSDIYSLGIVMYEMVTGRVPFDADSTVAVALMHLQEDIVRPSAYATELPVSLEGIILKCTQKSPDRRYETISALLDDLKRALVQPDKNFAVIPAAASQKTQIMDKEELEQLRSEPPMDEDEREELPEEEEEEEDDDDELMSATTEKIIMFGGIAIGIVILILILFLVGKMTGLFGDKKEESGDAIQTETVQETAEVEIPDIEGMNKDEAKQVLNKIGLGFMVASYEYSDEFEEDQIIRMMDVKVGDKIKENTTIRVVVSNGPETKATIPDLIGMDVNAAIAKLRSMNIEYKTEYELSDTVAMDTVISQSPDAGGDVDDATIVTLKVSQGQDTIAVPDVVGQDQSAAAATLTAAGFIASVTTENSDTVAEGKVISQSIAAGKQATAGTTINLVVSKGKASTAVSVPSVVGMDQASAKSTLESYGFVISISTTASDAANQGKVMAQTPTAGASAEKGATIVVSVGDGSVKSKVTVPNVSNVSFSNAQATLIGLGLNVKGEEAYSETVAAGNVISQTPEAGKSVDVGTTVTLVYSKGAEPTTPDPSNGETGNGENGGGSNQNPDPNPPTGE